MRWVLAGFVGFVRYSCCVANGYRFVDREQSFLLPPSLRDWLPADHLVWFLISVVAELDTSGFHRGRVQAGVGRAAYDPDMLLTLLIYGYAHGVGSSRRIESLCSTDVAFRVICAQDPPDHTTIARFRADHRADVEALFTAVLALCARAGLGRLGVVALDGTKIAVDASRQANRSESWLREQVQQMLAEAAEVDAAEDARYGAARGDELPAELVDPTSRQARIRRCLDELVAARRDRERAAQPRAARERRRAARADRDGEAEPEPDPAEADVAQAAESAEPADREADADRPGIKLVLCSHGDLVPRSHGDLVPRLDGDLMVRSTGALEQAVQRAEARLAQTWKRLSRRWTNYEVTRRLAAQGEGVSVSV
jgi:transposase